MKTSNCLELVCSKEASTLPKLHNTRDRLDFYFLLYLYSSTFRALILLVFNWLWFLSKALKPNCVNVPSSLVALDKWAGDSKNADIFLGYLTTLPPELHHPDFELWHLAASRGLMSAQTRRICLAYSQRNSAGSYFIALEHHFEHQTHLPEL